MRLRCIAVLLVCLLASPARADAPAPASLFNPARHMHVSEVTPGMTGYGLTVFSGTKIEKFDVQVVSVLKNFNPRYDVVLVTCSGHNLDHTGAIAGMSGSPIFLKDSRGNDRMIGAFAYGFPLAKDAIGGVQPIEYMLNLPTTQPSVLSNTAAVPTDAGPSAKSEKKIHWSLRDAIPLPGMKTVPRDFPLAGRNSLLPNPTLGGNFAGGNGRLEPLATPLMASGISSKVLDEFGPLFDAYGLHLLQAGATGTAVGTVGGTAAATPDASTKIEPGSVLAAPLITGDMELTATGTCTETIGDRVFAFGHPFNNEGPIDIPMGAGQINGIIASLTSSFKLGSLTRMAGSLVSDQIVGVAGTLGAAPPMVPMTLRLVYSDGSEDVTYHFNALRHARFTPLITGMAVTSVVSGDRDLPQYHTLDYDVNVAFVNGRSIHVQNSAVNVQPQDLLLEIAGPMIAAAENPFERVMVKEVTGTITVTPEAREAQILSVNMPKLKYHSGEAASGYVTYRPFRGAETVLPISFELPKDLNDGQYQLVVSDWQRFLTDEQASKPFRFDAESIDEVFAVLTDMQKFRHDAVYIRLVRQADGVAVGRTEMPRMPASKRNILLGSGRSNTTAFVSSTIKSIPTKLVMNGDAEFEITIDNQQHVEVGGAGPHATSAPKSDESKKTKPEPLPITP